MEKKNKKKKLVLIVDDHIMILKLTAEILEEAGYDATTVSSGREALEVLENQKPDVMLMDIYMPDMSGTMF
jgi:two-component system sensor histidine kinase ChiS